MFADKRLARAWPAFPPHGRGRDQRGAATGGRGSRVARRRPSRPEGCNCASVHSAVFAHNLMRLSRLLPS